VLHCPAYPPLISLHLSGLHPKKKFSRERAALLDVPLPDRGLNIVLKKNTLAQVIQIRGRGQKVADDGIVMLRGNQRADFSLELTGIVAGNGHWHSIEDTACKLGNDPKGFSAGRGMFHGKVAA
jgi:hypothetical protein